MPAPVTLDPHASLAAFFGAEIRRQRERLGWTQEQLAMRLSWSLSMVTKVERAERLPPDGFGAACDEVFALHGALDRLAGLVKAAPSWFTRFVEFESRATKINIWEMRHVPGLFQTAEYARAIITGLKPRATPEEVDDGVTERLTRQMILNRPDPPIVNVVLHESVVRQPIGDLATTREQLIHLAETSARGNVTLRVLPFSAACAAGMGGPFFLFEFADQPPVGYAEGFRRGRLVEGDELTDISLNYDRLSSAALTAEQTIGLLRATMETTWSYDTPR